MTSCLLFGWVYFLFELSSFIVISCICQLFRLYFIGHSQSHHKQLIIQKCILACFRSQYFRVLFEFMLVNACFHWWKSNSRYREWRMYLIHDIHVYFDFHHVGRYCSWVMLLGNNYNWWFLDYDFILPQYISFCYGICIVYYQIEVGWFSIWWPIPFRSYVPLNWKITKIDGFQTITLDICLFTLIYLLLIIEYKSNLILTVVTDTFQELCPFKIGKSAKLKVSR